MNDTLAGSREVEAHPGRSRGTVAVRRECARLGRETHHQRLLALQLLRQEERADRRDHEDREHRPDQGAGHRRRSQVIEARTLRMPCVRVHLIDPSGDVLPYDHALAAALARRGLDVELVTSRFVHGPLPEPAGYGVSESFYRLATRLGRPAPRRRRPLKAAEHVPDMLRYRRRAGDADVRHFQWLPLERIDGYLLPAARPRVLTMHNVIRREAGRTCGCARDGRRGRAHPPRRGSCSAGASAFT